MTLTTWKTHLDGFDSGDFSGDFAFKSDSLIYLNHAAVSPFTELHRRAMNDYFQKRSLTSIDYYPDVLDDADTLRSSISRLLNCNASEIAFVQNTSEGINLLVNSIDWRNGDEVIVYRKDFPCNVHPFLALSDKGVKAIIIEDEDYRLCETSILNAVSSKTRLITVSFVQFLTGQIMDLKKISDLCKRNEIIFAVDAIQGMGAVPLDLSQLDIDFLACGGHKWLQWDMGLGFVYINQSFWPQLSIRKYGWTDRIHAFDLFNWNNPFHLDAKRIEIGNNPCLLIHMAKRMMLEKERIGWPRLFNRIQHLNQLIRKLLIDLDIHPIGGLDSAFNSGIVSIALPTAKSCFLELKSLGIIVAERESVLRLSAHYYTSPEDCFKAVSTLSAILRKQG